MMDNMKPKLLSDGVLKDITRIIVETDEETPTVVAVIDPNDIHADDKYLVILKRGNTSTNKKEPCCHKAQNRVYKQWCRERYEYLKNTSSAVVTRLEENKFGIITQEELETFLKLLQAELYFKLNF